MGYKKTLGTRLSSVPASVLKFPTETQILNPEIWKEVEEFEQRFSSTRMLLQCDNALLQRGHNNAPMMAALYSSITPGELGPRGIKKMPDPSLFMAESDDIDIGFVPIFASNVKIGLSIDDQDTYTGFGEDASIVEAMQTIINGTTVFDLKDEYTGTHYTYRFANKDKVIVDLDSGSIAQLKLALDFGILPVVSLPWYDNFMCIGGVMHCRNTYNGPERDPSPSATTHTVVLYGYNDQGFLFRNSWGKDFGVNGKATIPYRFVESFMEAFAIVPQKRYNDLCEAVRPVIKDDVAETAHCSVAEGEYNPETDHRTIVEGEYNPSGTVIEGGIVMPEVKCDCTDDCRYCACHICKDSVCSAECPHRCLTGGRICPIVNGIDPNDKNRVIVDCSDMPLGKWDILAGTAEYDQSSVFIDKEIIFNGMYLVVDEYNPKYIEKLNPKGKLRVYMPVYDPDAAIFIRKECNFVPKIGDYFVFVDGNFYCTRRPSDVMNATGLAAHLIACDVRKREPSVATDRPIIPEGEIDDYVYVQRKLDDPKENWFVRFFKKLFKRNK